MLGKVPSEQETAAALVQGIERADEAAITEFFHQWDRRLKIFMLYRGMRADSEDMAMDVILTAISQIQAGALRCPQALAGYIKAIALHRVYQKRDERTRSAAIPIETFPLFSAQLGMDPEQQLIAAEKEDILRKAMAKLKPARAELLTRFYLNGQKRPQIQQEMGLNSTQFRLRKNRSKAKLITAAQKIAKAEGYQCSLKAMADKSSLKEAA